MAEWERRIRFVSFAILLLAGSFVLAKTGRDTLFVQERGLYDLPKAYFGIALLAGPLAFVVLSLLRSVGPRRVRVGLPLLTAAALVGFFPFLRPGGGPMMTLFFIFVPLAWGVVFSVSWLLAAELLDGADRDSTTRAFARVGTAALSGGLLAAILAKVAAPHVEPRAYVGAAIVALAMASAVMASAQRRYPPPLAPPPSGGEESRPKVWSILITPYVSALLAVGMSAGILGVLIEFRFFLAVAVSGGGEREKAQFFASFYLILNLAALLAQLWILPWLARRVGVGGTLLVLPAALVAGAGALAASSSLLVAAGLRAVEGGLKSSIHRTTWEQAYLPLPASGRVGIKVFVDGMAVRIAEGLAALGLFSWLHFFAVSDVGRKSTAALTLLLLGGAFFWLVSARRLSREMGAFGSGSGPDWVAASVPPGG